MGCVRAVRMRANTNLMEPWQIVMAEMSFYSCSTYNNDKRMLHIPLRSGDAGIPDSHPFKKRRIRKERQQGRPDDVIQTQSV